MKIEPHKINGVHRGAFYELDDGRKIYLAHRRQRQLFHRRNGWCIERLTLYKAQERGCSAVGIAVHRGKKGTDFYLARFEDFFGPLSFSNPYVQGERGLPCNAFPINPARQVESIAKMISLR